MAYQPSAEEVFSPSPAQGPAGYYSTPPPPPPKPQGTSTLNRGPPLPPPPPHSHSQNEPSELEATTVHPQYQQQQQQGPTESRIPPVEPGWLPETLREKTTTDLHTLLESPDLLSALLSNPQTTHPSIPASEASLQPLIEANIALANTLTQLEARVARQRAESQSRLLALRALEQQHRSKISETEEALKMFSPMALYQRLNASVQEQEQLVRGMEESWLDEGGGVAGERELADLMRRVREARKVEFLRRERRERWDEGRVGGWR